MASLKNVSISGIAELANAAADATQPIRKGEFDELALVVDGNSSLIATETELRITADSLFASQLSILSGTLGQNTALIESEETLRIDADSALATLIDTLEVTVEGNTASISSFYSVLSTVSGTLSTRLDTVQANFGTFQASVTSQFLAQTNASGALSSRIDTVAATAAGNTAAITEEATARVAADGSLSAKWGVSVDINGRISGIVLNDGTNGQSTFTISADKFQLVNPSYPNNAFPSKVIGSGSAGARFQTQLGGGTPYQFTGLTSGTVSLNANVSILGRLIGVGYGTGFALNRLRFAGTNTIVSRFSGQCRNATVWYRIIGQFTDWRVLATYGWLAPPSGGNFHTIAGFNQQDISVGATDQLEIGYNGLDGNAGGDTVNDANNDIWGGELMLEVVNY
jgi:hypothetical protein